MRNLKIPKLQFCYVLTLMQFPVLIYFFHETQKSFKQLLYSIRMDGDYKCQPQKSMTTSLLPLHSPLKILFKGGKKKKKKTFYSITVSSSIFETFMRLVVHFWVNYSFNFCVTSVTK